jgi:hypothetical protein
MTTRTPGIFYANDFTDELWALYDGTTSREDELRGPVLRSERAWADWFDGIPNEDVDRAIAVLREHPGPGGNVPYHIFSAAMGCPAPDPVRRGIWWHYDPPSGRFLDLPGGGSVRLAGGA